MRKLATVRRISEIRPIEGADRIELAIVDGWQVVVMKDKEKIGNLVIYCEIDSWIPHELAPYLTIDGHYPKVYNDVPGHRLKTKKLKGCVSQGLILPIFNDITGAYIMKYDDVHGEYSVSLEEGDDVTELLGIQKWERPIPVEMRGVMKGNFPSFIPKTDEERIQNLTKVLPSYDCMTFEVTEKLHGSSMTVYIIPENEELTFGVCSRNVDLKESDTNTYWKVAKEQGLFDSLLYMWTETGDSYALQGELIGEGINGNMYAIKGHSFRLYNIYNITECRYMNPIERVDMWIKHGPKSVDHTHVPILNGYFVFNHSCDQLLNMVEHKSMINPKVWVEGWVLKSYENDISMKIISNKFLLVNDE